MNILLLLLVDIGFAHVCCLRLHHQLDSLLLDLILQLMRIVPILLHSEYQLTELIDVLRDSSYLRSKVLLLV
jgi:hypothetical protein